MFARTYGVDLTDSETNLIGIQCDITPGYTAFRIDGLPVAAMAATENRIRASFNSMGLSLPAKMITVTIQSNSVGIDIAHFDLTIAMSMLTAMGIIPCDEAKQQVCIGGLSELGMIVPVNGALPAAIAAVEGNFSLVCPNECRNEAAWVGSVQIIAPKSLLELVNHFAGRRVLPAVEFDRHRYSRPSPSKSEKLDGRKFLTVCSTRCLYMDGQIYPIFTKDHEYF